MTLTPGSRLGVYEITALLGAGGMGEVYRARDTRLDRDVAIKGLPDSLAGDPAVWLKDGTIVFATNNGATGLQQISENGGEPTILTRADTSRGETDRLWPEALPGGPRASVHDHDGVGWSGRCVDRGVRSSLPRRDRHPSRWLSRAVRPGSCTIW